MYPKSECLLYTFLFIEVLCFHYNSSSFVFVLVSVWFKGFLYLLEQWLETLSFSMNFPQTDFIHLVTPKNFLAFLFSLSSLR